MRETTPRSRSTLTDVARMAGVSATTVSLVLAGKAGTRRISEQTHQRVHEAANVLGYTPNLLHRSMRRGRTHVVSFYNAFRNREWSDMYMDAISAAVEHACGAYGYDVLVHCNYARDPQQTYEFINGGFADGVVLFGSANDDPLLPMLRRSKLPTVVILPRGDVGRLSTVREDVGTGMSLIAEALLANGHRRVAALVEESCGTLDVTGRLAALTAQLEQRGVRLDPANFVLWQASATKAVDEFLALPSQPSALFVWHDRAAYRVVEVCEERGISVPGELSVIGYDGLIWPSTTKHVVASARVAMDDLAAAAVSLLDRLVSGEPGPFEHVIPVSFHAGTTLAPALDSIS